MNKIITNVFKITAVGATVSGLSACDFGTSGTDRQYLLCDTEQNVEYFASVEGASHTLILRVDKNGRPVPCGPNVAALAL